MRLNKDSASCPAEDAGYVLTTLSRLECLEEFSWRGGTVHWTVIARETADAECANEMVRRLVYKSLSTHRAVSQKADRG